MANDDMTIIAAITRKGGAGKTTLLRALISAVLADGKTCLALDADPQGALALWDQRVTEGREGLTIEAVPSTAALAQRIDRAYEDGTTDFVFIDTQGIGGAWIDEVAVQCDHIVIPVMLSTTDVEITRQTLRWYEDLKKRTDEPELLPKHHVILSCVPARLTKGQKQVAAAIIQEFPTLRTVLPERTQFGDMDTSGLLHALAARKRAEPIPLMRTNARLYDDAVDEVREILDDILGGHHVTPA